MIKQTTGSVKDYLLESRNTNGETMPPTKSRIDPRSLCIHHLLLPPPLTHGLARVEGKQLVTLRTARGHALPLLHGLPMAINPEARLSGREKAAPAKILERADRQPILARGKEPKMGNQTPLPPLTHGIARVEGRQAGTRRRLLLSEQQKVMA